MTIVWKPLKSYTTQSQREKVVLDYGIIETLNSADYFCFKVRAKNETRIANNKAGHIAYMVFVRKEKYPTLKDAENLLQDYILLSLMNHLDSIVEDTFPFALLGNIEEIGWIVLVSVD